MTESIPQQPQQQQNQQQQQQQQQQQRIEANLTQEGYSHANQAFLKYWSGDYDELLKVIQDECPSSSSFRLLLNDENKNQNEEPSLFSVLSIGAGDGRRDEQAIQVIYNKLTSNMMMSSTETTSTSMSTGTLPQKIIHYTAVEPNEAMLEQLQLRFQNNPYIHTLTTIATTAETFFLLNDANHNKNDGNDTNDEIFLPNKENLYDLILYTHSLYHMPGAERDLIQQSLKALKDRPPPYYKQEHEQKIDEEHSSHRNDPNYYRGPCIIMALSTEQGGIFQMMGTFWNVIDYSRFETKGTGGLFGQESLLQILQKDYSTTPTTAAATATTAPKQQYKFQSLPDVYIDVQDCFVYLLEETKKNNNNNNDNNDNNNNETAAAATKSTILTSGQHLLNFILQSDTSKLPHHVLLDIYKTLDQLAPPPPPSTNTNQEDKSRRLPHGSGIAVLYKY